MRKLSLLGLMIATVVCMTACGGTKETKEEPSIVDLHMYVTEEYGEGNYEIELFPEHKEGYITYMVYKDGEAYGYCTTHKGYLLSRVRK